MKLAHELGLVNVDEMLESISYPQFLEWVAYFGEVGFEVDNVEVRKGEVLATLHNLKRTQNSDRIFYPKEFIRPRFETVSTSDESRTGTKLDVLKSILELI